MEREEIKEKLLEIMSEAGAGVSKEDEENGIAEAMDSIRMISIIVEIEDSFGVEIPDEYLVTEFLENPDHVTDVIEQLMAEAA